MPEKEIVSRFLKSIDKYAKQQQSKIEDEIREIERKELEKSEARIVEEINSMIQKELISMKNKVSIDISHKELECRKNLSKKRQNILNEIFETCSQELKDYTKTIDYADKMKEYTKEISKVLEQSDVKLFVKKDDLKYADIIKKSFGRDCEVMVDEEIQIGGIKGYSEKQGVMSDETLDSSLEKQKEWFIQKYGEQLVY